MSKNKYNNPPKHDYDALRLNLEQPEEQPETPTHVSLETMKAIGSEPIMQPTQFLKNQHTGETIKTHRTNTPRQTWEDPTPTVVPGLAPDIKHIMAQQKMGIPVNIATRTIETYYKNLDLTDVKEMSNAYIELAAKLQDKKDLWAKHQQEQKNKQQQDANRILSYLNEQNKQAQMQKLSNDLKNITASPLT
jgi:hypothetical protein